MKPPFPGMDPYLEAPTDWPDVHASLIYAIRDQIQQQLSARYVAVITPYVTLESLEISPSRMAIVPDVGVAEHGGLADSQASVAVLDAPLVGTVRIDIPTRYARLEVRAARGGELVTAIELLSPANKRPGVDGTDAYERKRQELFRSTAHLLEIDLLRAGQRPQLAKPLPNAPYFIFLSRAQHRPQIEIWPLSLHERIPIVPVPLLPPDPDVPLDLGAALEQIYASARYERRVDYNHAPLPPDFSSGDLEWIDRRLREKKLRAA